MAILPLGDTTQAVPGRLAILLIVGLIAVLAAGQALRSYLNPHLFPTRLPDTAP
jgi:hypothetical protein